MSAKIDRLAYLTYRLWRAMVPEWSYCKLCREPYDSHAGRFRNLCRLHSADLASMSRPVETHEVIRHIKPAPVPVRRIAGGRK